MNRRGRIACPLVLFLLMTTGTSAFPASPLDEAVRLQREGRNREAQNALRTLLPELRRSGDRAALGRVLAAATDATLVLGEYESAVLDAQDAFDIVQLLV